VAEYSQVKIATYTVSKRYLDRPGTKQDSAFGRIWLIVADDELTIRAALAALAAFFSQIKTTLSLTDSARLLLTMSKIPIVFPDEDYLGCVLAS
jgi:hypothetical protein